MIDKISVWAEQIIVAVIIVTLIEMILPNGNNKKYIRTVIGVYILFTIISPVFANKGNFQFNELDYENYFKSDETYTTMSDTLSTSNDKSVEEIYIANLKQDITNKLKEKDFNVEKIAVQIDVQEGENYGSVLGIDLTVSKIEESSNENKVSNISVNTINTINIGNTLTNENRSKEK
jgi:stage III sporulation protein AF